MPRNPESFRGWTRAECFKAFRRTVPQKTNRPARKDGVRVKR